MIDFTFNPEPFIGGVAAAMGSAGVGIWAWSKLRRALAHDATDTTAHKAMQVAMEGVRAENVRLHDEVGRLRGEIDRLRETVTVLTGKIADMGAALSRKAVEDQLAREGKLDRRKTREGAFDSRTQPGPLPDISV